MNRNTSLTFLFLAIVLLTSCNNTNMKRNTYADFFSNIKSLKVYPLENPHEIKNLSADQLNSKMGALISNHEVFKAISKANHSDFNVIIKQYTPGLLELKDGTAKKIIISHYGDFFIIEDIPGYFYFDETSNEKIIWAKFVRDEI